MDLAPLLFLVCSAEEIGATFDADDRWGKT